MKRGRGRCVDCELADLWKKIQPYVPPVNAPNAQTPTTSPDADKDGSLTIDELTYNNGWQAGLEGRPVSWYEQADPIFMAAYEEAKTEKELEEHENAQRLEVFLAELDKLTNN